MKGASVRAVVAGAAVAALLGIAAGFLLWPRLIASGVVNLEQFNHRVLYILAGALAGSSGRLHRRTHGTRSASGARNCRRDSCS